MEGSSWCWPYSFWQVVVILIKYWVALGCLSVLGFTLVYIVNVGLSFTLPLPTKLDSRYEDVLKAWSTLRVTHAQEARQMQRLADDLGLPFTSYDDSERLFIANSIRSVGAAFGSALLSWWGLGGAW